MMHRSVAVGVRCLSRRALSFVPRFGDPAFWSSFYEKQELKGKPTGFEWFCDYDQVAPTIHRLLATTLVCHYSS